MKNENLEPKENTNLKKNMDTRNTNERNEYSKVFCFGQSSCD
jgi:hypothetical protein